MSTIIIMSLLLIAFSILYYSMLNSVFQEYHRDFMKIPSKNTLFTAANAILLVFFFATINLYSLYYFIFVFFVAMVIYFSVSYTSSRVLRVLNTFISMLLFLTFLSISIFIYDVVTNTLSIEFNMVNSLFILTLTMAQTCIAVFLFVLLYKSKLEKLLPKPVSNDLHHLTFTAIWAAFICVYLIINLSIYSTSTSFYISFNSLVIMPIILLLGFGIIAVYTITISALYKKKTHLNKLLAVAENEDKIAHTLKQGYIATCEINCTNNSITPESIEALKPFLGITKIEKRSHDEIMYIMATNAVYVDDVNLFLNFTSSSNLMAGFFDGKNDISIDYRQMNTTTGFYEWTRAAIKIVLDPDTQEVIAVMFLSSIHKEKLYQIELKFKAERDMLTRVLNKISTESAITKYISDQSVDNKYVSSGALFIIDVDNFKTLNDTFGHTYGDAVLCEIAEILRLIFRDNDIIGRIGGDEFIVFVKGISSDESIKRIANKLCTSLKLSYKNHNSDPIDISASIGIAKFPEHGDIFSQLYNFADIALYQSKNLGKNTYNIYAGQEFRNYKSTRTEIATTTKQVSFDENRVEHIFRLIQGSPRVEVGIYKALELAVNMYDFDRGFICEHSNGKIYMTFEWTKDGLEQLKPYVDGIDVTTFTNLTKMLYKQYYVATTDLMPLLEKAHPDLLNMGFKAVIAFGIFDEGKLVSLIGYSNCNDTKLPTKTALSDLNVLSQLIGLFYTRYCQKTD